MVISMAYAQEVATQAADAVPPAAMEGGSFALSNIALIGIMVVMFYFLLIRPQQKRFKEHQAMLGGLKKGDKIVTAGGLVGKIEKLPEEGGDEVLIDLGNNVKVTALRHTIQTKVEK